MVSIETVNAGVFRVQEKGQKQANVAADVVHRRPCASGTSGAGYK